MCGGVKLLQLRTAHGQQTPLRTLDALQNLVHASEQSLRQPMPTIDIVVGQMSKQHPIGDEPCAVDLLRVNPTATLLESGKRFVATTARLISHVLENRLRAGMI